MIAVILTKGEERLPALTRARQALADLPLDKAWRVEITAFKARRSVEQNALLWSLYDDILERGGEAMGGWTKDDLHQFFLIEHFGSETRKIFGKRRLVPRRRSSRLSKLEFSAFVDFVVRFMAEQGVVLKT